MDIPTLRNGPDKRVPPTDGPSENENRRDALVASVVSGWIIKRDSADLTSRSLRKTKLEGHACHARRRGIDSPTLRRGPDKQVPPKDKIGGAHLSCPHEVHWTNISDRVSFALVTCPSHVADVLLLVVAAHPRGERENGSEKPGGH